MYFTIVTSSLNSISFNFIVVTYKASIGAQSLEGT